MNGESELARAQATATKLVDALLEALEFAEDQEDVVDGSYGEQHPNKAMQLCTMLRTTLEAAGVKL